jgi:hypothetical protein
MDIDLVQTGGIVATVARFDCHAHTPQQSKKVRKGEAVRRLK